MDSVVLTPLTLVNKGQVNPESVFRTGQSMASMRVNVTGFLQLHGLEKLVILLELAEITFVLYGDVCMLSNPTRNHLPGAITSHLRC